MTFGAVTESAYMSPVGEFLAFTDGTDAIVITLNPRETVTFVFNIDSAGTTDDIEIEVYQGHLLTSGTLDLDAAASTTDVELMTASDPIATDDDLNGTYIVMTSGTAQGDLRLIIDSVAADDGIVPDYAFTASIAAADTYHRYSLSPFRFIIDATTTIGPDNTMNDSYTAHAANGQKVLIAVRVQGTPTDAHRIKLSYQVDGVSV